MPEYEGVVSLTNTVLGLGRAPARIPRKYRDRQDREQTIDDVDSMTERIKRIADPIRSSHDIWKYVHGKDATRETRMEVVAWVACTQHGCRLEGGFVRDWVVGGFANVRRPPAGDDWVQTMGKPDGDWKDRPEVHPGLGPQDLDMQLPLRPPKGGWFDIERFVRSVQGHGISVDMVHQDVSGRRKFIQCPFVAIPRS